MRRELIAVGKTRANIGKAGRQRSEAGEVRGVSHLAVGSHGGSEHEKGLGRQWPGAQVGSAAPGVQPSHSCPGPTPGSSHPRWFWLGSHGPLLGCQSLAPVSVQRAGLRSWEEKPRAYSQVPGQWAWALQLCFGLAPGPASLGTELIEEKCSPQPRQPAAVGVGGRGRAACLKAVGMVVLTILSPRDQDTSSWSCHSVWRIAVGPWS